MDSTPLSIIPRPVSLEVGSGEFILGAGSRIEASPALSREAEYLAGYLRRVSGFPLGIVEPQSGAGDATIIRLVLDSGLSSHGKEAYRLTIDAGLAELRAIDSAGIFLGIQTLLQLFPPAVYGAGPRLGMVWSVPQLKIEDHPRFAWRGAMLDCGRQFRSIEFVRKFIDLLALHKLNVFHWHLTEDQGWRIEIKKYPRLTEVGAWRNGTWQGHANSGTGDDGKRHGGFYTQEQIREIVRYAADRHITIVPEIEMPGHAQAALAAYPEFGCTGNKLEVWKRWGVCENIFHPKEETLLFLQDILTEVMELFPSPFIHIGGDEAVKKQWDESAEIRALMEKVGAKDSHEMQSYFIRRMDRFLTEHGRRLVGWDEILEGGLAEGATVMSWRGTQGGIAAANLGHDVVMTPEAYTYFDHYQSEHPTEEPLAIGGCMPLQKVYDYEPVTAEISAENAPHILGVQGQLWGEYMPTTEQVEYMAFPRLCALAETAWSPVARRDYGSFFERLPRHLKRLDLLNVKYRALTKR